MYPLKLVVTHEEHQLGREHEELSVNGCPIVEGTDGEIFQITPMAPSYLPFINLWFLMKGLPVTLRFIEVTDGYVVYADDFMFELEHDQLLYIDFDGGDPVIKVLIDNNLAIPEWRDGPELPI